MKRKAASSIMDGQETRKVNIYVDSLLTHLTGQWQWDMMSDAVFCSDVIISIPYTFHGTKGIIHPDDVTAVREALYHLQVEEQVTLSFRMITTHGEVKTLTGTGIHIKTDDEEDINPEQQWLQSLQANREQQKELELLKLRQQLQDHTEKMVQVGTWFYNRDTQEVFYSDQVYHIYGIPPQGLNAHLNTFISFIHPDDRDIVNKAFDKSFEHELSLHIEFRLLLNTGEVKLVRQQTQWTFGPKGERMLFGNLQELTIQRAIEQRLEIAEKQLRFQKMQLTYAEQHTQIGFWSIDFLTRKTIFSDNFYRIYGLKPQQLPVSYRTISNYVHPDDQKVVADFYQDLRQNHTANDIEYRITRSDGKMRYILQKGKLTTDESGGVIIFGTIQDISFKKILERKLEKYTEELKLHQFTQNEGEAMAHMGTWWWDESDERMNWSESFYYLLGLKPNSIDVTQKHLIKLIYTEDRPLFTNAIQQLTEYGEDSEIEFDINRHGTKRHIKASFKLFRFEEKKIFIGIFHDITREQDLQQQLRERVRLAELLTEHILDRVMITDMDNNILLWNKRCEAFYKLKKEQVLQHNIFDIIPQLNNAEKLGQFHEVMHGKTLHLTGIRSSIMDDVYDLHMIPLRDERSQCIGILHIIHDVTKETQLRERLEERLGFIESLVESSVDRIIVLDRNMNYLYWNQRSEEYYDILKKDIIGKNILEVFPSFVNDPTFKEFRRALYGETVHIPANPASKTHSETYLIPLKNERKEVTGLLWIVHDLRNEYRLRKEQEKAEQIINTIDQIYFELDNNGIFKYVNRQAEIFWNRKKEELIGRNIWEVFPQAKGTGGFEFITRSLEEKVPVSGEYFSAVLDRWVYMTVTPIDDGVIVFFYDIDITKRAQQKIAYSEALLREAEKTGNVGSYELDVATGQIRFSEGLFQILGEAPNTIMPTIEFIDNNSHPEDAVIVKQILEQAIQDKKPYHYTRRIYRKDGEMRFMEINGKVICNEEDQPVKLIGLVKDITERKKIEDKLIRGQHFLQSIADTLPDVVTIFEPVTNEATYVNERSALALLGYTTQELMKMGFTTRLEKIIHPEDRDMLMTFIESINRLEEGHIKTLEYRIIARNGEVKWVLNRARHFTLPDDPGSKKLLTILQDITEAKAIAATLQENARFISDVMEATPDFIMVFDFDQDKVAYVNRSAYGENESRYHETMNMDLKGLLSRAHPEDVEALIQFIQGFQDIDDVAIRELEYRVVGNNEVIWYHARGKVFKRNNKGVVTQYISVIHDITEEVNLRQALYDRTIYAESLIDSSVDRMFVIDREFKILAWNRKCEEYYHKWKENVIGKNYLEVFPMIAESSEIMDALHKALQGEQSYLSARQEIYLNTITERFYIPLKNESGEVTAILCVLHDVTKAFQAREELKELNKSLELKNHELENKHEEITTFAFVASHDLKEPLRKIHTFSDWLLQTESEHLSTSGKDYLKRINQSVKRVDSLIEDILVLTKIHADRQHNQNIDLNHVLSKVTEECKNTIAAKKANVQTDLLPVVMGNENQMVLLFRNLISNAMKFQPDNNTPVISISCHIVSGEEIQLQHKILDPEKEYAKVTFSDNGIGVDPKYARKIFQVFQRLHTRDKYDGTGMGLAICKKIMENHHGFIQLESSNEAGSSFACYFPL